MKKIFSLLFSTAFLLVFLSFFSQKSSATVQSYQVCDTQCLGTGMSPASLTQAALAKCQTAGATNCTIVPGISDISGTTSCTKTSNVLCSIADAALNYNCCSLAQGTTLTCAELAQKWSLSNYSCLTFDKCNSAVSYFPPGGASDCTDQQFCCQPASGTTPTYTCENTPGQTCFSTKLGTSCVNTDPSLTNGTGTCAPNFRCCKPSGTTTGTSCSPEGKQSCNTTSNAVQTCTNGQWKLTNSCTAGHTCQAVGSGFDCVSSGGGGGGGTPTSNCMTTATGCTGDPNQHCGSCTAAAATSNCPAFCSSNQNTHWEIQGCVNGCCAITSTTVGPICTGNGGTTTPPVPGTATCPSTTATLPFTWTATGTNPSVNVQLCDANRNNCQQVPGAYTLPTGGQGATATGLTAGSTYTWNVTATANNNVSTTVWGNNITCGGGGTPTAPTNVSATCTGTNATVNFTLGQDNVNAYVYYCDKTTETTNTQCETWDRQPNGFQPPYGQPVSGSSANITVPNAGDTYAYFVRSCNGVNTLNATTCVDSTLGTSGNPPTFTCSSTPTVTGTISPTVTGAPSPTVTGTPTCTSGQTNPYFSCSGNTCVSNSSCGTNSGGCTAAGGSCNVQSGDTTLTFTIGLDGIGTTGDSVTTVSTGSNKNPNTPTRTLNVKLFDTTNKETDFTGTMTYDSNTSDSAYGLFTGTVDLGGSFTGGSYTVKVSTPGHLVRLIPGTQTITSGTTNAMPQVRLVAGDINSDNYINILDYNLLMSCSNDVNITNPDNGAACSQNANYAKNADLDDNGVVNSFDYNLFLREYSVQNGD